MNRRSPRRGAKVDVPVRIRPVSAPSSRSRRAVRPGLRASDTGPLRRRHVGDEAACRPERPVDQQHVEGGDALGEVGSVGHRSNSWWSRWRRGAGIADLADQRSEEILENDDILNYIPDPVETRKRWIGHTSARGLRPEVTARGRHGPESRPDPAECSRLLIDDHDVGVVSAHPRCLWRVRRAPTLSLRPSVRNATSHRQRCLEVRQRQAADAPRR